MKKNMIHLYLRFHVFIILTIVAFSGFLSSYALLKIGPMPIFLRYPVAALISYVVFVVLMHYWKQFLEDLGHDFSELQQSAKEMKTPGEKAQSSKYKWYDGADVVSGSDDLAIIVIVFAAFFVLFYFAGFLIIDVPILLVDLVLSGIGASLLRKSVHKADNDIFVFRVLNQTLGMGLIVIAFYFLVGFFIYSGCPQALKFSDVFSETCKNTVQLK